MTTKSNEAFTLEQSADAVEAASAKFLAALLDVKIAIQAFDAEIRTIVERSPHLTDEERAEVMTILETLDNIKRELSIKWRN